MPPARGIIAANSPYDSAPAIVSAPARAHAIKSQLALPSWRPMSAETMKIPDPIMTPTTTITESNKPRPRANVAGEELASEVDLVRDDLPVEVVPREDVVGLQSRKKGAEGRKFVYYIQ